MNKKLLDALESCLQRIEQGEPLDAILAHYPELAAQLRPLLEAAVWARSARVESLPLTALARQRARGLALAAELRQGKNRQTLRKYSWRPVMTVLAVFAILVMSSNGLLIASAHSIPGDTLYPLKRSVESTQLRLVSDPDKRQILEHTFDERRVDETRHLITDQRVEEVEFTGVVASQSENEWLVSGISVVVTSRTEIDSGILVGDTIEVEGVTNAAGVVEATHLTLVRNSAIDENDLEGLPTLAPSSDESGESSLQETPSESAVDPAPSSEDGEHASDEDDRSSDESHQDDSSGDSEHSSQSDSGGERD